jgi:hypothetical protein
MKTFNLIPSIVLVAVLSVGPVWAQPKATLSENAALRYWAAFSQVQDLAITGEQAKELNAILDGTAPYDDLKYKDLIGKNKPALEIMARGTLLQNCDWGLDYRLGEEMPVDYARNALVLGRLNVLYAFHLLSGGDKDGAVSTLAAGLRFSQDVATGGSLFATLVSKDLLSTHLRAAAFALRTGPPSPMQRLLLQKAIAQLGPNGLDWQTAAKRDLEILRDHYSADPQASAALTRITSTYVGALNDPSQVSALKEMVDNAPQEVRSVIPNPVRVLEQKQDLSDKILQARSLLQ